MIRVCKTAKFVNFVDSLKSFSNPSQNFAWAPIRY